MTDRSPQLGGQRETTGREPGLQSEWGIYKQRRRDFVMSLFERKRSNLIDALAKGPRSLEYWREILKATRAINRREKALLKLLE